jgi:two-component system LytT family sensor kinase
LANVVGQTWGFAIGMALAILLLVLVIRFGGDRQGPRFFFAACMLVANSAGLAKNIVLLLKPSGNSISVEPLRALGYAAAAMLPLCIVMLSRDNPVSTTRRRAARVFLYYSVASGVSIAVALIVTALQDAWLGQAATLSVLSRQDAIGNLTFYNGLATVVLAWAILLPRTYDSRTIRIGLSIVVLGLVFSSFSALLESHASLPPAADGLFRVVRFQSSILVVIGMLLVFSRFRAADVFAKYALRLLLGAVLALSAAGAIAVLFASTDESTIPGRATGILASAGIIGCAIALYFFLGKQSDLVVERRIFARRESRLALQEFRDEISMLDSQSTVLSRTRSVAAEILGTALDEISIQEGTRADDRTAPDAIAIPCERAALRLVVSPANGNQLVLLGQLESLRELAAYTARRLEDLHREQERIESARLESRLNEQLARAELRALRAQVNPHFLFNSLNTIASLIVSHPHKAETITLRLANVFRYVLIHADMPFSSLDEEIGFLRTYLDVERIRFGDRLQVEFDIDSSIAYAAVPSLILQPLVENAIKHGIAPKVGNSRITVRTRRRDNSILMIVEDDGIGLRSGNDRETPLEGNGNNGVGLRNIRERLNTLYGAKTSLCLTERPSGGSCATVEIPLGE